MIKIEEIKWSKVKIDHKNYFQVLIISEKVYERDTTKLNKLFGTSHQIGDWEKKLLLSGHPQVILVANGWQGVLQVDEEFKNKILQLGIDLKVVVTPQFIKEYNHLIKTGKSVNCLIHTTC